MKKKYKLQKMLGYLFLVPALITMIPYILGSIMLFYNEILHRNSEGFRYMPGLNPEIIFDSYFPIYIGLMALCGGYLIKDKNS